MFKLVAKYLLSGLICYWVVGGIFSYLLPVSVSQSFKDEFSTSKFQSPEVGVDRAMTVESPNESFAQRISMLRSAEKTLDICYYGVTLSPSSECFFSEVLQAADRGVQVRLLLDGKTTGLFGRMLKDIPLALAAHPNIEYRMFNRTDLLRPWTINVAMHDKFIIMDDERLILGGRNVGDLSFDPPWYEGTVSFDREVLIINTAANTEQTSLSVITETKEYMDTLWNHKDSDVMYSKLNARQLAKAEAEQKRLHAVYAEKQSAYPAFFLPNMDPDLDAVPTRKVSLIYNPVTTAKKEPWIGYQLSELMRGGRDIFIQTPYCPPGIDTLRLFKDLAQSADSFVMQTNSLASSPNLPAYSTYYYSRKLFVETGVRILEYQNTHSIHGKSFMIDDHISIIGSFNLDDRSLYIDTETMLVIDSPEYAAQLKPYLSAIAGKSAEVGADNRYVEEDLAKALPVHWVKRILFQLAALIFYPFIFLV